MNVLSEKKLHADATNGSEITDLSTVAISAYRPPYMKLGPIDGVVPEFKLVRQGRHDSSIHDVKLASAETIDIAKGERATLMTWGLSACTSTLIASRDEKGLIRVTLTHFPTRDQLDHEAALRDEGSKHFAAERNPLEISVICAARGRISDCHQDIKLSPNAEPQVRYLRQELERVLVGRRWNFQVIPYDADVRRSAEGSAFIARFFPELTGNGSIEIHNEYCGTVFPLRGLQVDSDGLKSHNGAGR